MGGGGALTGVKLAILAGILTILDMVDRAWSIVASQVSGRRKQPLVELQPFRAQHVVFSFHF